MSGVTQVPHWTQPEIILSLRIPNYNTIPPPPPPLLSPIPLIHFLTTTLPSPSPAVPYTLPNYHPPLPPAPHHYFSNL